MKASGFYSKFNFYSSERALLGVHMLYARIIFIDKQAFVLIQGTQKVSICSIFTWQNLTWEHEISLDKLVYLLSYKINQCSEYSPSETNKTRKRFISCEKMQNKSLT